MPNIGMFLTNDQHLLPLLKWYLQQVDEKLESVAKLDDSHYEYIKNPDGTVSGFRPDVICEGQAGGQNITEGYWRAFAQSLARDQEMPEKIRVVSFINHSNAHWTCSVAEFSLDPIFYKKMQDALRQRYSEIEIAGLRTIDLQNFINEQFKSEGSDIDIIHSQKISGSTEVAIHHYDSHNPGRSTGGYYLDYQETLNVLMAENLDHGPKITLDAKDCKRQVGNTCGDSTLYNGYTAGVLGLDLGLKEHQVESQALRAFTEDYVPVLTSSVKDKPQVQNVIEFVAEVTKKVKQPESVQVLSVDSSAKSDVSVPLIKIDAEIHEVKSPVITPVYSAILKSQVTTQLSGLSSDVAAIVDTYISQTHKDFVYGLKQDVLSVFNGLSLETVSAFGNITINKTTNVARLASMPAEQQTTMLLAMQRMVTQQAAKKTAYKPGL